jgi:hypothetical protein
MAAQRTLSWGVYDSYFYGISRGFLREALNHMDLAEGVCWLVLVRTRAFLQVERAAQCIMHSGRTPGFTQGECPLCHEPFPPGTDFQHLLVSCKEHQVNTCRSKYLEHNIAYLDRIKAHIWESAPNMLSETWGETDQTRICEGVVSVYLLGGMIRLEGALRDHSGWFDAYQLGFGHFRLVTPGFTTHHYVPMAQFLQEVAPLWTSALGQELYNGGSDTDSLAGGSLLDEEDVNQMHTWLDDGLAGPVTLQDQEVWQETVDLEGVVHLPGAV